MDGDLRLRMREVPCPYCLAHKGYGCTTPNGRRLKVPHVKRINAWYKRNDAEHGVGKAT